MSANEENSGCLKLSDDTVSQVVGDEDILSVDPIEDIIDYLVRIDSVLFKSQQSGETNMSKNEKKRLASDIYSKSKSGFLARFGEFLKPEHLNYFRSLKDDTEAYELSFYVNRLQRFHSNTARKKDVKNRRFQALQNLVKDGTYFSEKEMMMRNPLLYDQLVGRYLSEKEIKARDNIDTANITFVNLLMEKIDRDRLKEIKKMQEDSEQCQIEEEDDDEEGDDYVKPKQSLSEYAKKTRWGEFDDKEDREEEILIKPPPVDAFITAHEKLLFKEEFVHEMYSSFLEGRDTDFDYSAVDSNQEYDNIDIRSRDEEENYFDSESPEAVVEIVNENDTSNDGLKLSKENESEDELEIFMEHLSRHHRIVNT